MSEADIATMLGSIIPRGGTTYPYQQAPLVIPPAPAMPPHPQGGGVQATAVPSVPPTSSGFGGPGPAPLAASGSEPSAEAESVPVEESPPYEEST